MLPHSKAKRTLDIIPMAHTSLIEDESLSFNSDDMQIEGYYMMGDSPPYPEDPAADLIPPDPRNRGGFETIPIANVKSSFDAIPMDEEPPQVAAKPQKSSGGGRLLMKKTIDKAVDTAPGTTEPSMYIDNKPAEPVHTVNFVENNQMQMQNDTGIFSTPASSFALFTKMPPVGSKPADVALPFPVADNLPPNFDIKAEPQRPIVKQTAQQRGGFQRVALESKPQQLAPFIPAQAQQPQKPFIPGQDPAPFVPEQHIDPIPFIPTEVSTAFIPAEAHDPEPFIPVQTRDPVSFIPTEVPAPFIPTQKRDTAPFIPTQKRDPEPFIPTQKRDPEPFIPTQKRDPAPFIPTQKRDPEPFIPTQVAAPFIPGHTNDTVPFVEKQTIPSSASSQATKQKPIIHTPEPEDPHVHPTVLHTFEMPKKAPVYDYVAPESSLERGFAATLDRSIASLKRMFTAEFSSLMRNKGSQTGHSVDFDEFTDSLTSEIAQVIDSPVTPADLNVQQFSKRIIAAIEEHTKPVTTALAETELRNSTVTSTYVTELKHLKSNVDKLRTTFKSKVDGVMRELECERQVSAAMRDMEQNSVHDLESRMRAIKLKKAELESKLKHQQRERENIDRIAKQHANQRYHWEDGSPFSGDNESIHHRLVQELSALIHTIDEDENVDIAKSLENAIRFVKDEEASMRNDLHNLEVATRFATMKQQIARGSMSKASRMKVPQSSVITEVQNRVHQVRKQRGMR